MVVEYCDYNNDGTISECEVFDCIVMCENEWRAEYCPDSENVFCENPYEPCETCDGAWTCGDIEAITFEVMAEYDTNGDG